MRVYRLGRGRFVVGYLFGVFAAAYFMQPGFASLPQREALHTERNSGYTSPDSAGGGTAGWAV